jgi:serine/threonine protein kinase/Tol biopolymer transport system component
VVGSALTNSIVRSGALPHKRFLRHRDEIHAAQVEKRSPSHFHCDQLARIALSAATCFARYNGAQQWRARLTLASGTKLGPYEIQSPLGAGGMGEVYRARDTRLDRTVAIKILPQPLADNPVAKERFDREARAISSLNHPNICHLYDVGSQDGISYLVMEYLEGESLADRLRKGSLPLGQTLRYGRDICDGLETAHRSGVIHRDLKPGNIMLTKTGAKLMDFGLAKPLAPVQPPGSQLTRTLSTPDHPLTAEGTIIGTFQYMSPEQVEGTEADARSDIFSLGTVLYEMVTGRRAFEGKTTASTVVAILASEPQPISSLQPKSPPALDQVVRTCLAKEPDDRFQNAHDVKLQLQWITDPAAAPAASPIPAWWKSERVAWGVCTFLLVLLAWLFAGRFAQSAPAVPVVRASILPPEDTEFFSRDIEGGAPAISPDGRQIVVAVRDKKNNVMLWLRPDDSESMHPLVGTEGAGHPFWSPDSHSIGFFAGRKLKRIDVNGGALQTLCDVSIAPRGGSWNRDGVILFTPGVSDVLYRVSANGGTPVVQTELDKDRTETSHRWPQFLPDGKHYLFFLRSWDKGRTGIYVGSVDSKERRFLLHTGYRAVYVPPGYLLYLQDQTLVAQAFDAQKAELEGEPNPLPDRPAFVGPNSSAMFSASQTGILLYYPNVAGVFGWNLTWHDRTGKSLESIGQDYFSQPTISPDATKVAVATYDVTWWTPDVWILDLVRGTKTRFSFDPQGSTSPFWQPDGQAIIYGSIQKGKPHIYRKALNGKTADVLLETDGLFEIPRSICHDGRYLAYLRREGSMSARAEIWILPLFGDRKPFSLVQSQFDVSDPVFSPDCKWVAYTSSDPSQPEVYVTSFPDGVRKYQVSTGGGQIPRWRADGKELFFLAPQNANLVAVNVERNGLELSLGTPHALFQAFGIGYRFNFYDVSPDGQRFLISGYTQTVSNVPLTLVSNWSSELRK